MEFLMKVLRAVIRFFFDDDFQLIQQQQSQQIINPAISLTPFDLDTPLLHLSPSDVFTLRNACEGVHVFGGTGSGKSSASGSAIAKAFLRAGYGGLVLCAKPDEAKTWQEYAAATGREDDLIFVRPKGEYKFNFLDYELQRDVTQGGGETENIVNLLMTIVEIVEGDVSEAGGDKFWTRAMRQLLRNAINLLSMSRESLLLEEIIDLILTAPRSPKQIADEEWRKEFCAICILMADQKEKTRVEAHDYKMLTNYWLKEFPNIPERTRGSIEATFTSIASILLSGSVWDLLSTETNFVPESTYLDGAVIVLDISVQHYQQVGKLSQAIIKFVFQRSFLARDVKEHPRPVFLWADESQNFISKSDFTFQAVARSARACTVYMTQNVNSYYAILGAKGREQTKSLLGNLNTKIFHSNTDDDTNRYAAETIGKDWRMMTSISDGASDKSGNSGSASVSEQMHYKCPPIEFTYLRKGGKENDLLVDAIVFQGGRRWKASGDTFLKTTFKQGE